MKQLKDALREVALRVSKEEKFKGYNPELYTANASALALFGSSDPMYRSLNPGDVPINIGFWATLRVSRFARQSGIEWRLMDWSTLLDWLFENWTTILRLLFRLLILI